MDISGKFIPPSKYRFIGTLASSVLVPSSHVIIGTVICLFRYLIFGHSTSRVSPVLKRLRISTTAPSAQFSDRKSVV